MEALWVSVSENLTFVCISAGIVCALLLLSRLSERWLAGLRRVSSARRVCIVGICAALAAVLYMLDAPLLFLAPEFYKIDLSELPVMLCGFYLGPCAVVSCEGAKVVLKLLLKGTSTAFVGDFANFVVGCAFTLPACIVYHLRKSRKSALVGLLVGTACLTVFGSVFNAVYLLPKFSQLYGISLAQIVALGTQINAGISDIATFVLLAVAPLNLIKGAVVSVLTMLLYKKVARPLFGLHG